MVHIFLLPAPGQLPTHPLPPPPLGSQVAFDIFLTGRFASGLLTIFPPFLFRPRPSTFKEAYAHLFTYKKLRLREFYRLQSLWTAGLIVGAGYSQYEQYESKRRMVEEEGSCEKMKGFRLWEKSESWTLDDAMVGGAAIFGPCVYVHKRRVWEDARLKMPTKIFAAVSAGGCIGWGVGAVFVVASGRGNWGVMRRWYFDNTVAVGREWKSWVWGKLSREG